MDQFKNRTWFGSVTGPNGDVRTCSDTVFVVVPPCPAKPCPASGTYPGEPFNDHFINAGVDLGGRYTCFMRGATWDDDNMPHGVNGPVWAWVPPACNPLVFWRNRDQTGCFAPGTAIRLADGRDVPIEELKPGMMVANPLTSGAAKVAELVVGPEREALIEVSVGERKVRVTSKHPFLAPRGLIAARDLAPGDEIYGADGAPVRITGLRTLPVEPGQVVMNLRLDTPSFIDRDRAVLADGVVAGDLGLQELLTRRNDKVSQWNQESSAPR